MDSTSAYKQAGDSLDDTGKMKYISKEIDEVAGRGHFSITFPLDYLEGDLPVDRIVGRLKQLGYTTELTKEDLYIEWSGARKRDSRKIRKFAS